RHDQVHAGRLNAAQRADRAAELALERAPEVHLLLELRAAELGFVENLEADAATPRQTRGRELEPQLVDAILRDFHARARVVEPIRNLLRLQLLHDRGRVFRRKL